MRSFKHALCFILGLAVSAKALATPISSRFLGLTIDGLPTDGSSGAVPTTPAADNANTLLPTRSTSLGHLTNAKRLALGLPLLPPTRRSKARRSLPSSVPTQTVTGIIQIRDATSKDILGYVIENTNNNNHLGYGDASLAIPVSFAVDPTATVSSQLDIAAVTSYAAAWPLMGGIVGLLNTDDDLKSGSSNYAYIQGTTHTPAGSPPIAASNSYPTVEDTESGIWSYDSTTGAITAQWVNTDSGLPPTSIMSVAASNALVITGDTTAFAKSFATSTLVTFTLVAAQAPTPP
ncbi:hypothetical protein FIBSPDRAFT_1039369 [Athelia psychrophila]|uniref:Uncharacterized protein n=1 Tax=Athelia psychrophila TaxID=1759441 RepID=A0A166RSI3_9AGAM|nr:hypothetical protein FIBSPDRAFT_1039369 [Fibularhizoctonia sp. CBS 109695]